MVRRPQVYSGLGW